MKTTSVLLIDGPGDGQWVETPDQCAFYVEDTAHGGCGTGSEATSMKAHPYYVGRVFILGRTLRVGIWSQGFESSPSPAAREEQILRAILKSKVAKSMGVGK